MEVKTIPVKITKVCSNDSWPLIYLPKEVVKKLGLTIGKKVLLELTEDGKLIVKPIEA